MAPAGYTTAAPGVADKKICGSELDVAWLLSAIAERSDDLASILANHTVVDVTACEMSDMQGFVSRIHRVTIHFETTSNIDVILKLPDSTIIPKAMVKMIGEEGRKWGHENGHEAFCEGLAFFYNRECRFYRCCFNISGLKLPRVYRAEDWRPGRQMGAVLMEDLSHRAVAGTFYTALNMAQIRSVVEQLVLLLEFSLTNGSDWSTGLALTEHFTATYPNMKYTIASKLIQRAPQLAANFKKLEHLYDSTDFFNFVFFESHRELGIPDQMCHGDLWSYNIMLRRNADGSPSDDVEAIIDWQNVHPGSVGEDLARLLCVCADPQTRRNAEQRIFPELHEELSRRVHEKGFRMAFTQKQLISAYRRAFVVQALHLPFLIVVMDSVSEHANEFDRQRHLEIGVKRAQAAFDDAIAYLNDEMPRFLHPVQGMTEGPRSTL